MGHAGEVLGRLADRMVAADIGRMPIIDPATRRVVDLVARKDLLHIRAGVNAAENERAAFFGRDELNPADT